MYRTLVISLLCLLCAPFAAAQTFLDLESRTALLDSLAVTPEPWESVDISGRLRMEGLPLSPSVRIFMLRDSLVRISLRAPFVGEVGRAEVTDSAALVVNKMNKTYLEQPLDSLLSQYTGAVADLQRILLGQMTMPGVGAVTAATAPQVDICIDDNEAIAIVPGEEALLPLVTYGYLFPRDGSFFALRAYPDSNPDKTVTVTYIPDEGGYDIDFLYTDGEKVRHALLQLDAPKYGSNGFGPLKPGGNYRQVSPGDFLKAF